MEFYSEVVRRRGADANIGPRLPILLLNTGFEQIQINVVQPAGLEGEAKLIAPITLECIADAVIAEQLATRDELDAVLRSLYAIVEDHRTVVSLPRVVQAWARCGAAVE